MKAEDSAMRLRITVDEDRETEVSRILFHYSVILFRIITHYWLPDRGKEKVIRGGFRN